MKQLLFIFCFIYLYGCGPSSSGSSPLTVFAQQTDSVTQDPGAEANESVETNDSTDSEMATYFLVIVDTSADYFVLQKKMYDLHKHMKLTIDTMERFYNTAKNRIVLPDDHSDEIYAGDYFPRRFPSENLSLEYLDFYLNRGSSNTMALVSGIYANEHSADSAVIVLRKAENKTYKLRSKIFIGCMH